MSFYIQHLFDTSPYPVSYTHLVSFPDEIAPPASKPWALTGTGEKRKPNIINSLYLTPSQLEEIVKKRFERYEIVKQNEVLWDSYRLEDAEYMVVAYGATARICKAAVEIAREMGVKAGLFRPVTLWPYPTSQLAEYAKKISRVLCVEMSMGQMVDDVRLAVNGACPVSFYGRTGGIVPTPDEVAQQIVALAAAKA